jgi:hypothetical protein
VQESKERMKGLLKEIGIRDELLGHQEKLLIQERENNQELKKLLKLEREKNDKLDQEIVKSMETISSLKSSSGALQDSYDILQKLIKILKCNLMLFCQAPPSIQTTIKLPQVK